MSGRRPPGDLPGDPGLLMDRAGLEAVLFALGEGVSIQDRDYRVLYQNRAHRDMMGDCVGQSCYRAYERNTGVCDGCPVARSFADGGTHVVERAVEMNGEIRHFEITASPLRDASGAVTAGIEVVREVTARRRAMESLRRSEETLKSILRAAPVAVGLVRDRVFQWVNGRMLEMLGYAEEELIGRSARMLYPDTEEFERVGRIKYGQLESADVGSVDTVWLRKDGERLDVYLQSSPVDRGDPSGGVVFTALDITERKRGEDALRESELRFKTLFERAGDGILVAHARDRRFALCNRAMCEMLGYTEEELLSLRVEEIHPEQERPRVLEAFRRISAGEIDGVQDLPLLRKDGELVFADLKVANITLDGTLYQMGLFRDVTARRETEEALKRTQFVMDRTRDAVYWIGPDARFLYVNDAACRNLGYSESELLGMTVMDISPGFPAEAWPPHWEDLRRRGAFLFEAVHRRKDGSVFPVEISANHVRYGGREYNCAFARDLSQRKEEERERRNLERQLQHVQKLESLGVLAGGIAHDFNNILMAILGNADLALTKLSPSAPGRRNIEEIETAAQRAAELCQQMLAYSGKGRFVIQRLHLSEIVEEMSHMLEISVSKSVVLKYHFASDLPAVEGDATQIRQVVLNLITNASEAIGSKSGVISVSTGAMVCDRAYLGSSYLDEKLPEGVYAYLEVADTGCGMDEETKKRLFDPFFTTKFTGRGLGMSAVLGIVRGHRGAIKIYSEVGKGTSVKVLFPAVDEPAEGRSEPEETGIGQWRGRGTVLVVDDEESVCAVARQMLEYYGFRVLTAGDGQEALRVFRLHGREIVCVVLDLTMPHMDGEVTFRELRRIDPEVRVLLSSGYNQQDVTQRFVGKGLAGFIQKPYKGSRLVQRIRAILEGDGDGSLG